MHYKSHEYQNIKNSEENLLIAISIGIINILDGNWDDLEIKA